jgi:hypothetical protein
MHSLQTVPLRSEMQIQLRNLSKDNNTENNKKALVRLLHFTDHAVFVTRH